MPRPFLQGAARVRPWLDAVPLRQRGAQVPRLLRGGVGHELRPLQPGDHEEGPGAGRHAAARLQHLPDGEFREPRGKARTGHAGQATEIVLLLDGLGGDGGRAAARLHLHRQQRDHRAAQRPARPHEAWHERDGHPDVAHGPGAGRRHPLRAESVLLPLPARQESRIV